MAEPDPAHRLRTEGPTPAGGEYAIGYFFDDRRRPCPRAEAVHFEVHEFDAAGVCIARTYATRGGIRPAAGGDEDGAA